MSFLPAGLEPYAPIITFILLLVDGFIIGYAAKRAVVSVILLIVAIALATFIGFALPFSFTQSQLIDHLTNIIQTQVHHVGLVLSTYPIAWIIGIGLGVWKG